MDIIEPWHQSSKTPSQILVTEYLDDCIYVTEVVQFSRIRGLLPRHFMYAFYAE